MPVNVICAQYSPAVTINLGIASTMLGLSLVEQACVLLAGCTHYITPFSLPIIARLFFLYTNSHGTCEHDP